MKDFDDFCIFVLKTLNRKECDNTLFTCIRSFLYLTCYDQDSNNNIFS